jgi:hypothetical protein
MIKYMFPRLPLLLFAFFIQVIFYGCNKKEDEPSDTNPEPIPFGVATVNGLLNEYGKYKYFLIETGGTFENNLILFRGAQEKIHITFRGTDEGIYKIVPGDTTTRIRYYDAGGRMFKADSGSVNVAEFTFRNGAYTMSGGFAFNAFLKIQFADTSYSIKAAVRDGAFLPITNN